MPEGPEITLNVDLYLRKYLLNKELVDVEILSGKYVKKKPANYQRFTDDLPAKVINVNNKGKFAYMELDNGWSIGGGFGMTGRLSIDEDDKHNRMVFVNEDDDELFYADMRNFGNWYFWDDPECLEKKLNELGPDIIKDDSLSKTKIVELFRKYNKQEVTQALMSQKVLAGIGNYLKAESLYDAKIYPFAKVKDLSDQNLYDLYKSVVKWAKKAYKFQLSSFADGVPYESFQDQMNVYNHSEDKLGNKVLRSTKSKDKRTTWWVKEIQTIGK